MADIYYYSDSTVQTLTLQPTVQSGRVTYQDSPLVIFALYQTFNYASIRYKRTASITGVCNVFTRQVN